MAILSYCIHDADADNNAATVVTNACLQCHFPIPLFHHMLVLPAVCIFSTADVPLPIVHLLYFFSFIRCRGTAARVEKHI
ncbi:hypothetical protein SORBI_3004G004700 [Sorghum bicolor]|uniref:Uncharacterized protein n=1 Tax=Sorghum bicolor TaxID=4558 RepID=A0A194YM28_SORBI|nr:hypothetical protein SORBI_3004G004700 [Sorghum bicolor]